jgi:Bardet-Biedl syndrome 9 protein
MSLSLPLPVQKQIGIFHSTKFHNKSNTKINNLNSLKSFTNNVALFTHRDLKGIVVTLSDSGRLECSYMGTDPALFIPPPVEARELNYADMDKEMAQLQKIIKEKQANAGTYSCI